MVVQLVFEQPGGYAAFLFPSAPRSTTSGYISAGGPVPAQTPRSFEEIWRLSPPSVVGHAPDHPEFLWTPDWGNVPHARGVHLEEGCIAPVGRTRSLVRPPQAPDRATPPNCEDPDALSRELAVTVATIAAWCDKDSFRKLELTRFRGSVGLVAVNRVSPMPVLPEQGTAAPCRDRGEMAERLFEL